MVGVVNTISTLISKEHTYIIVIIYSCHQIDIVYQYWLLLIIYDIYNMKNLQF